MNDNDRLLEGIANANMVMIESAIINGADINILNSQGIPALMMAIEK
jgi:hypothetical protein